VITNNSSSDAGRIAECIALGYLENKNLSLLGQNYRCPYGEIDLIMQDKDTIVFIEVRSRKNKTFLDPVETIDRKKMNKIIKTAENYIQRNQNKARSQFRFDVVTLTGKNNDIEIQWIKDAFEA